MPLNAHCENLIMSNYFVVIFTSAFAFGILRVHLRLCWSVSPAFSLTSLLPVVVRMLASPQHLLTRDAHAVAALCDRV